jgi:hypothetical protein
MSMTKISGSISQKHGSADPNPDPHQNVMDPQHCFLRVFLHYLWQENVSEGKEEPHLTAA